MAQLESFPTVHYVHSHHGPESRCNRVPGTKSPVGFVSDAVCAADAATTTTFIKHSTLFAEPGTPAIGTNLKKNIENVEEASRRRSSEGDV